MAINIATFLRLKRYNLARFVRVMSERHPELRAQVTYDGFLAIAERERVIVQTAALPDRQRARTFAVGQHQFIQLNRSMAPGEMATQGMHELCHIWRDKPIDGAYYSDELTAGPSCDFADLFAWRVTSPARMFFDPESNQLDLPI